MRTLRVPSNYCLARTKINDCLGPAFDLNNGVPQWPVPGPTPYFLFINDTQKPELQQPHHNVCC